MHYVYLMIAIVGEVIGTSFMKQSDGFTRLWPTAIMAVSMAGSVGFLALAMRTLPLGTAYTIWTGIGAVGAFLVGIAVLGEQASASRILAAGLIGSGLVLMKLSSPG